jgi:glutamate-1-semialdehyde 2,1-aminomutase
MDRHGVPARVQGMGSMLQAFFTDLPKVGTYREALRSDLALFSRFAHQMIRRGVFVHPDGFEHWFVSAAHGEREVGLILDSADDSIAAARASS